MPRWLFEAGAGFYGWMTMQDAWRRSCRQLVERLPSTDRPLRIIDVGCGPGVVRLELARCRPKDFVSGMDVATRMLAPRATACRSARAGQGPLDLDSGRRDPDALQGGEHRCGHGTQRLLSLDGSWRRPGGVFAWAAGWGSTPHDGAPMMGRSSSRELSDDESRSSVPALSGPVASRQLAPPSLRT